MHTTGTKEAKVTIEQLSQQIAKMHSLLKRRSLGDNLQMLVPTLKAMELTTSALSLPHVTCAPLFIAMNLASHGIYSSESQTGIIGKGLSKALNALSDGLIVSLLPQSNAASRQLLSLWTLAACVILISMSSQSAANGIGQFSSEMHPVDVKLTNFFSFELALSLINNSEVLETVFTSLIEACGGTEKSQKIGALIFAQISNLFMILTGSLIGGQPPADLLSDEDGRLTKGVQAVEAIIEFIENEDLGQAGVTAAGVKQLFIALKEKNYDAFLQILDSLLNSVGTSLEELSTDIRTLAKTIQTMAELMRQTANEQPMTGVMNVI